MSDVAPLVSVIIPTTRRHDLVQRAIASVFSQTIQDFEIIVVIDGPNPATRAALDAITDGRLRVLQNERASGPGPARNRGADAASGRWLAFLDDDDAFLPTRLERMVAAADDRRVMLCSRAEVRSAEAVYIWPREPYRAPMAVDEYLFDRTTLFHGARYIATSSLFLPRDVFAATQFGTTSHNEDRTLLLRVTKTAGVPLEMLDEVLVRVHLEATADSAGPGYDWRAMLRWATDNRPLLTRRAISGFCLVYLGSQAARRGDRRGLPILLWQAVRHGRPRAMHLLAFAGFWLVPTQWRRRVRARLQGASRAASAPTSAPDATAQARS